MKRNKLRELLRAGQPTLGTRLHSSWPSMVEVIGHTGVFDYVEFLAEYAPYHLYALDDFCRAAELYDLSAVIKMDHEARHILVQPAIGAGFQGVLFANCRTRTAVYESLRSLRPDTPAERGDFGAVFSRFGYMDYGGGAEYIQALKDIVVMLMIEKQPAVAALEEMLSFSGIDLVQWGPADYAMSIGWPGGRRDPEVKAVERRVIETAIKLGVPPRAEISSVDEAKYYLDLGVRHFSLGVDLSILYGWLKKNGESLRLALNDE